VLEPEGALTRDRRARFLEDELPQEEVLEQRVEVLEVGRQALDGAGPEDPAHHRGALQERLLRLR
jgi:hypothetical protein